VSQLVLSETVTQHDVVFVNVVLFTVSSYNGRFPVITRRPRYVTLLLPQCV